MANNGMDMESGSQARYLGSAGETIPSEDDDPENTANPTTNGIPAGRYIIRGVTARNNTISGNCDGIKFSLAEDCSCRGNTVRLSDSHTYNNMGISVAKGSNIRVSYNNLSGGNGYGIYAVGTEASQKICRIYEIQSQFMKGSKPVKKHAYELLETKKKYWKCPTL